MHQAGGQLAVGRGVELEKSGGIAELGGDVLQRILGQRRHHHRHAGAGGGSRGGQVAVAVLGAQPDDADRRHEQRARQFQPEQVDGQITVCGADEHPRHQTPPLERLAVDPLGALVARTAGDVGPH